MPRTAHNSGVRYARPARMSGNPYWPSAGARPPSSSSAVRLGGVTTPVAELTALPNNWPSGRPRHDWLVPVELP